MATEFLNQDRASGVPKANRLARARIENAWETREGRFSIVSGKSVVSKLSDWSNTKFNVSFSSRRIAKEILPREIASEIADVITAIENNQRIEI